MTAVATVLLFGATISLVRSSNRQVFADGPLLKVFLFLDTPTSDVAVIGYAEGWAREDSADPRLKRYVAGQIPPRYVYLGVSNTQIKSVGVSSNLVVKLRLYYGADDIPNHENVVAREVTFDILEANSYYVAEVFNVGNLTAFMVSIDSVEYRDIHGRRRTAAYGASWLADGPLGKRFGFKIFEPRKGEFTSANRN